MNLASLDGMRHENSGSICRPIADRIGRVPDGSAGPLQGEWDAGMRDIWGLNVARR